MLCRQTSDGARDRGDRPGERSADRRTQRSGYQLFIDLERRQETSRLRPDCFAILLTVTSRLPCGKGQKWRKTVGRLSAKPCRERSVSFGPAAEKADIPPECRMQRKAALHPTY